MQLALLFWRFRVGECRRHRLVLSAYVPQKTAGSQLGESEAAGRDLQNDELVAGQGAGLKAKDPSQGQWP